jgi:hypothetical protein
LAARGTQHSSQPDREPPTIDKPLDVVEIAAQLGHGPGVTLSTYAHLLDSLGDGRVDADVEIERARERLAEVA